MKIQCLHILLSALLMSGCTSSSDTGRNHCDRVIIGNELGGVNLSTYLLVPKKFMHGSEIINGGIVIFGLNCSKSLKGMISDETAEHIIEESKNFEFNFGRSNFTVAKADLFIWKYRNSEGKMSFFVLSTSDIAAPVSLPSQFRS